MPSKIHVTGGIKSVSTADRNRVIKENKKFKLTINMLDGNKVYIYTDSFGLRKLKVTLNIWWTEYLNDVTGDAKNDII